tara:strand:+ start:1375 stop:1551 length:177 start_codon:yes stop_codon:yes gene_type:complete
MKKEFIKDKCWDRQKFIDRQRRRKKYRFFIRIKNNATLYWLYVKDILIETDINQLKNK